MADNFLTWWSRRCGRNWAILGSIIAGLIAMITLYNLAKPVVAEMRFWATPVELTVLADRIKQTKLDVQGDLSTIAERVYPRSIADQIAITKSLEARLLFLKDKAKVDGLPADQWAEIPVIEQAIRDSRERETRILKERTYFQMQKDFR